MADVSGFASTFMLCTVAACLCGCGKSDPETMTGTLETPLKVASENVGEVNVYTHRHYPTDQALYEKFTADTGISVNIIKAKADELIKKLEIEGADSRADLLITVDAGRLVRAKQKNLLQPVTSPVLEANIPAHLRDPEGYWCGLTVRARVIVYAKDRVRPADLSTYEALTDQRWQGKVLIRSSKNIYNQSLLASFIHHSGAGPAEKWATDMVATMARTPKGNDRDQIKAVVAGVGDVAVVNTYYVGLLLNSDNPKEREIAEQVGVFFPNQDDRGTHINISGAGVTAAAPNKDNAIKLLEFLSSEASQKSFAMSNYEYPLKATTEKSPLLTAWGDFKADALNLSALGELNAEAVKTFDRAGWR